MRFADAFAPARIRGVEYLDDPAVPDDVRRRSLADVARSNVLFGGRGAIRAAVRPLIPDLPPDVTVLDVGTGHAELAALVRQELTASGRTTRISGVDISESVARSARGSLDGALAGNALRLPVRDASADLVICSQLLHHFTEADARVVLAELHRVSRGWVVVADLRRSRAAAAGFWIASLALGFHPITRHDGVVSVLRGFTHTELATLVQDATHAAPVMRKNMFWRISAAWRVRA